MFLKKQLITSNEKRMASAIIWRLALEGESMTCQIPRKLRWQYEWYQNEEGKRRGQVNNSTRKWHKSR